MNYFLAALGLSALLLPNPSNSRAIEQTIGGMRVGKDSLKDFSTKYHSARAADGVGTMDVYLGEDCLFEAISDGDQGSRPGAITSLTLTDLHPEKPAKSEACLSVRTSRGIFLSSTIKQLNAIYGKPRIDATRKGLRSAQWDNIQTCNLKHPEPIRLRTLYVEYNPRSGSLVQINVSIENYACDGLE